MDNAGFVDKYLARIEYKGDLSPTLEVLRKLCWANVTHVPFFTLDMWGSGERKTVDMAHIERNILDYKWGGMCYEINSLFYRLLKCLGFNVKIVKGKLPDYQGHKVLCGHMSLVVTFEDGLQVLTDCSVISNPLLFNIGEVQQISSGSYKIEEVTIDDEPYLCLNKMDKIPIDFDTDISTINEESITTINWMQWIYLPKSLKESTLSDFIEDMEKFQKEPQFSDTSFLAMHVPNGSIALIGEIFLEKECYLKYHEKRRKTILNSKEEINEVLEKRFRNLQLNFEFTPHREMRVYK